MPGPENHLQSAAVTLYGLMARRPQIYEKYTGHDQCFAVFRIKIDDNAGKIPPGHAVRSRKISDMPGRCTQDDDSWNNLLHIT